ncbi:MAG: porin [Deltaproteobacteria bacterium]|nr:porin [Deltaproteobacteria bacterium]
MKHYFRWIGGVSVLLLGLTGGQIAQAEESTTTTEAAPAAEKPKPWSPVEAVGLAGPLGAWGLEIHGFVGANYTFNFNEPTSGKNGLLLMNRKHDELHLDLANIRIQRVVDGGIGFVTDFNFGKTAEVVGRATRWCKTPPSVSGNGACHESRNSFEANQFYLTYKFPIGNGLGMKLGKFVTLHGAEVIKTWDNMNYNISNSVLFGYAIPFTHTGVLFNYPLTDWASLDAGLVTGWDQFSYKANDGIVFTGGMTVTPHPTLTFYGATTVGPEQDDRGDSKRALFTLLATYKPTDQWTFILDYNHADETDILPPIKSSGRGTKDARWDGLAGYAIYQINDMFTASLRTEFFDDVDGVRTGTKQTVWEITPTIAFRPWWLFPGLTVRLEYRHDESSKRTFAGKTFPVSGGSCSRSHVDADCFPDYQSNISGGSTVTRYFPGQDTFVWEASYAF